MSSAPTPQQVAWLDPIRRHPLVAFFALAFGLAWAILVPMTLASHGLVPFPAGNEALPLLIFMGYGPTIAAVLVSAAVSGRAGISALLKRLLIWRVGWRWWAAALFLNGAIILGALGLYGLTGHAVPPLPALGPALLLDVVVTFLIVGLINGEEVGWRGFALPRLQERHDPLEASLLLGVVWTAWHLPYFFWIGHPLASTPFPAFVLFTLAGSVVLTWLTRGAGGSALPAMLLQAVTAAGQALVLFGAGDTRPFELSAGLSAVIAVLLVLTGRLRPTDASAEHV